MRNDPPTSLRRVYGYHQARAAGLGGIRIDRSPRQVNREIKENQAARRLKDEIKKDSEWDKFVKHWIASERSTAEETLDMLLRAQAHARMRANGYSVKWCSRHWPVP